jgi:hypothetical protein
LIACGTPEQKAYHLPKILAGEVGARLLAQAVGEGIQRKFARRIRIVDEARGAAGERPYVDDIPAALRTHRTERRVARVKSCQQVDLDHPPPLCRVRIADIAGRDGARGIHENVEPSEPCHRLGDYLRRHILLGHIAR